MNGIKSFIYRHIGSNVLEWYRTVVSRLEKFLLLADLLEDQWF